MGVGIVGQAAIAETQVKHLVRPEKQRAAVVVFVGLRNLEQHTFAGGIHPVGIGLGYAPLAQSTPPLVMVGVIEVELAVAVELRMKRQTEQPLLVPDVGPAVGDVQEHLGLGGLSIQGKNQDRPALFDQETASCSVGRFTEPQGTLQGDVCPGGFELEDRKRFGGGQARSRPEYSQESQQAGGSQSEQR